MPEPLTEHLTEQEVCAVVVSQLDLSTADTTGGVPSRVFDHLAGCASCRRDVAALKAIVTGEPIDAEEEPENSLAGYRAVPFVPSVPVIPPVESWSETSLAAQTDSLLERLPAFHEAQRFRSADGQVEMTVTENLRDDTCRVYLRARPGVESLGLSLYLPPGVVCPWPRRSYLEFPLFTFKAVDWTQTKLLYALQPSRDSESPENS